MNKQASLSEDTNCPICLDIPKNEVFQCVNGHTICGECLVKVSKCPQCSLPYDAVKIRNRALESILDKMSLDCAYKSKGCGTKLTRKTVVSHNKTCSYGAIKIKLCKLLGFACEFEISTNQMQTARAHLTEGHDNKVTTKSTMSFSLTRITENGARAAGLGYPRWTPYMVDIYDESFLVFLMSNEKLGQISMHFLMSSGDAGASASFNGEFRIKADNSAEFPDLVWSAPPIHIKKSLGTIHNPITRFPQELWKNYRNSEGNITIRFSITKAKQQ